VSARGTASPDAPDEAERRTLRLLLGGHPCPPEASGFGVARWERLLDLAGPRLAPWAAEWTRPLARAGALPAPIADRLERAARVAAAAALRHRTTFHDVAAILDAAAIPFVVLKGMALAHLAYPAPWLRPMADLDLWVPPEAIPSARTALEAAGWRPPRHLAVRPRAPLDELPLEWPRTRARLELHAHPLALAPDRAALPAIRARGVERVIADRPARVLADADQFAHVAQHLVRKNACRDGLLSLLDLTWLARVMPSGPGWDSWAALGAAHRAQGLTPWCALAAHLARDLADAPIPRGYLDALGPSPADDAMVRAAAEEQLWDRDPIAVSGVDALVAAGRTRGPRYLLGYVRGFYLAPAPDGRAWWRALGARLRWDLTHRATRYWRAWRAGTLAPDRVAHRARLHAARERLLAALVGEAGEGSLTPP
jgi:hypothetical protein